MRNRKIWNMIQDHWRKHVAVPSLELFLCQLEYKGQSCADRWTVSEGSWTLSDGEATGILTGNMFCSLEMANQNWADRDLGTSSFCGACSK